MTVTELRKKTKTELLAALRKAQSDYEALAKDLLQKKEKNVKKLGAARKDLARVKTLLAEGSFATESKKATVPKDSKKEKASEVVTKKAKRAPKSSKKDKK
jgi:ribosomal protein L29